MTDWIRSWELFEIAFASGVHLLVFWERKNVTVNNIP
jgi:hypothetical protein